MQPTQSQQRTRHPRRGNRRTDHIQHVMRRDRQCRIDGRAQCHLADDGRPRLAERAALRRPADVCQCLTLDAQRQPDRVAAGGVGAGMIDGRRGEQSGVARVGDVVVEVV